MGHRSPFRSRRAVEFSPLKKKPLPALPISWTTPSKFSALSRITFYAIAGVMGLGALRNIVRPLSRTLISRLSTTSPAPLPPVFTSPTSLLFGGSAFSGRPQWVPLSNHLHSLTDTRFPKRRPSDKPRRKRASMKPPGPYAWVQYVPGEPILPNRPNEGSVKGRNEKKRMRQHRAFVLAERKKRKAQLQEAKRMKNIKRVERKMAAVARERAWAERLAELKRIEEEKKASMA